MLLYVMLFAGAFLAACISGSAGFGGALLLLPLLVSAIGVTQAVPLLTVAQFVGNASRAGFGFRHIVWKPVGWFMLGAAPASVVGALLFIGLPKGVSARLIGAAILLLVALRIFKVVTFRSGRRTLLIGGAAVGLLSGLVGSAGPLGAAIFLSLDLSPVAYVASEATTALAMHSIKAVVYGRFIALDRTFWFMAIVLGAGMVSGTWAASRFIARLDRVVFRRYVAVLLAVTALYMLVHG